ncbi:hypothetical protein [Leptospira neocaledonica]|uniref:Uncharacterized protein n=1 Tax=Leptospira neocaledonica TaxID=2023192 RepID=A0A2M9ZWA4_9LEPT|nr:hypothetical protein [Leptospira neocaledonica]PJZ76327.1 hypothetical protein CH365_13105 [Leptospira neocaledonica]
MRFPTLDLTSAPVIYEDKQMRVRAFNCQRGNLLTVVGQNFRPTTPNRLMLVLTLIFENPHPSQSLPINYQTIFAQYRIQDPDVPVAPGEKPGLRPPEMIIQVDKAGKESIPQWTFGMRHYDMIAPKDWLALRFLWSFPKPKAPDMVIVNRSYTAAILDDLLSKIPMPSACDQ